MTTRTAQDSLRASVASMGERQIALAARAIGVSRSTLVAYAEGRSALPEHSLKRLGDHLYRGKFLIKVEEWSHARF
jgi:hypothetical protein